MKSLKFLNLIVLGLVLTVPFAGCKKNPRGVTPLPGAKSGAPQDPGPGTAILPRGMDTDTPRATDTGIEPIGADKYANYKNDREIFKAQTVLFDFDSAVVKGSEKAKVGIVAAHLKGSPSHALKVEGHCDERGTEEYNRALGERRALAVREALVAEGIAPDRIVTISFGEDKPAVPGHDEAAYRQNRRGEFILLTPP